MNFINHNIRRQTLLSSIIPALFLMFLLFIACNYPFSDIFSPKHIDNLSDLENQYSTRQDYVNLTNITLYYTGYDSIVKNKLNGHYYYAFAGNRCFFFLLESERNTEAEDSITFDSLNLKLVKTNSNFSSLLANLSADIDWSATHLTESSPAFLAYEYKDVLIFSYFFAGLLAVMITYTVFLLLINMTVFAFPFLQKGMLPCSGFSAKKKLFSNVAAITLKEKEEIIHIRFSSRGHKQFFIAPSFLLYFSTYDTHILPVKDIIWIYQHVTKPAHGISETSSMYTVHFILNSGRHIQFKNCPEKNSNALIALLAGKNPDILVGYSEEHKALAKRYLALLPQKEAAALTMLKKH